MSDNFDKNQNPESENKVPKKRKKSAKQIAKELETLERGRRVIDLKKAGASFRAIAEKLKEEGVKTSYETVRRDYLEAMKILHNDHIEEALVLKRLQNERLESLLLAHYTPAIGKTYLEVDADGKPVIDPRTNQPKKVIIPPDTEAGRLVLKTIQEISELNQLKPKQTQLSGKGGGPVETTIVNLTMEEWREQVKKRREEAAKTMELYSDEE
ncbi:MAG TPA: hypothetical protein PKY82_02095 [Pyrinomonadaceae bacterium]|nr:hypothetical protein [Pyrinomonadaceae bacterium]